MLAPMGSLLWRQESRGRAAQSCSSVFFTYACTWCLNRWQLELFGRAELSLASFCCDKRSFETRECPKGSAAFGRLREVGMS